MEWFLINASTITVNMQVVRMIVSMFAGCGCFLVGINLMSRGFVRFCDNPRSIFLRMFTSRSRTGVVCGSVAYTMLVQSSSATTLFTLKLLNIGAITLIQAMCMIMGANIGTTITSFIVALSSLNLEPYFAFAVFVGALLFLSNKEKTKNIGEILSGFGLVFVGLQLLGDAVDNPTIHRTLIDVFSLTDNPILLILIGTAVTALLQSSSVSISIIVFMVGAMLLPLRNAIYLVMGANIGACITAVIAAIGENVNPRRAAFIHIFFNVFGALLFMLCILPFETQVIGWFDALPMLTGMKIALFHFVLNLITTIVLLPLCRPVVWLSKLMVPKYR